MSETVLEDTVADVLRDVLQTVTSPIIVAPSVSTVEELVSVLRERDGDGGEDEDWDGDGTSVRLLVSDEVRKAITGDFLVASGVADLVAADRLALRTTDSAGTQVIVGTEAVVALVSAGDQVAGLGTDDRAFVESANQYYGDQWDDAAVVSLHTPGISRVRETLAEEFDQEVVIDFDSMLSALDTARGDGQGLDEVTICLLVAAKNENLFYDISSWGEDVGLASEATFSRTKTRLEEIGLVDTEKVPIEVGRPRQRLLLADSRIRGADAADVATTTRDILADRS